MAHYFTNDENLKSEIVKVSTIINDTSYYFYTDNGVFSKGEIKKFNADFKSLFI